MKTRFLFILAFITSLNACAQSKWMFETYNYIRQPGAGSFVPMLQFEAKNNWYGELRYNYEDVRTLSMFGGRTISGGKAVEFTVTPMLGLSVGEFTGLTFATNIDAEWKNFYLSLESQYSKATEESSANFFFNWSELGYSITNHLFAGLAVQYTCEPGARYFEPGFLAGLNFKNISAPFYIFSPFSSGRYFVLGLNIEYSHRKKKNKLSI